MRILILGSEGFVGHNLVLGLEKKYEVFTADQLEKGLHRNYAQLDITNFNNIQNAFKDVDVVIDLVAHTLVSSLQNVIENARVNIIGLLNILESCRKNDVKKVIFTSASSIIGEPRDQKVSEKHPVMPKTAYGITKMASEHYLRLYYEMYGVKYVIFRFFNIYGPYQKNGLIPSLYASLSQNKPITIFGDGKRIRDYVYIEDTISFFDKSISSQAADNLILNIGTGKGTTINEIVENLSRILGVKPNIEYKPERPGEIGDFVADTTLLSSVFGNIPKTNVNEGLEKTIAWLNNYQAK